MGLSNYTTGVLRDTLPPGILHASYPLHVDKAGVIHDDLQCGWIRRPAELRQVSPSQITSSNECHCISQYTSSPPELSALDEFERVHMVLEFLQHRPQDQSLSMLHGDWSVLHGLLHDQKTVFRDRAKPVLQDFILDLVQQARAKEQKLRTRLRDHPDRISFLEADMPSQGGYPPPGRYLLGIAGRGLVNLQVRQGAALACLGLTDLDPWGRHLLAEADHTSVGLLALHLQYDNLDLLQEPSTHVRLEETDTPEIIEIARTLWEPQGPTPHIQRALEIARQV